MRRRQPASLVLIAMTVVATLLAGVGASPSAAASPSEIQAVYVVASDVAAITNRQSDIAANVETVQAWFADQTGGRMPVFATDAAGKIAVPVVTLTESKSTVATTTGDSTFATQIEAQVPAATNRRLFIIYEGTESSGACGYSGSLLVIPTENCGIFPNASSAFPYGITYLMAHELTHLLGAVSSCAPNYVSGGHVGGDNRDILFQPTSGNPRDWSNLMLDPGNDDYFNHGRSDCTDIADSALFSVASEPSETGFNGEMPTARTIEEIRASRTYQPAEHGDILRLYQAIFNREPDVGGAIYWIHNVHDAQGLTVAELTPFIATDNQPEFRAAYAEVQTNADFLTRVYLNMLDRIADQDGFDYWLNLMDNEGLSRANAVRWVAQSAEFEALFPYTSIS